MPTRRELLAIHQRTTAEGMTLEQAIEHVVAEVGLKSTSLAGAKQQAKRWWYDRANIAPDLDLPDPPRSRRHKLKRGPSE